MEGMIDLASFVNERVYEKSLEEKGVTLGFGMSQDKNTDSCRAIVRRTDHMATKTTSLQNAHAQMFNGQKSSPSHKHAQELHRDALRQYDQSSFVCQGHVDTSSEATYLCAYILTSLPSI